MRVEKVELKSEKWGKFPLITPVVIVTTVSKREYQMQHLNPG